VYPRALSLMPLAPMWSALFFFMLFLLGVGSQMVILETVVTGLVDEYKWLGRNSCIRFATTCGIGCLFCLVAIAQTTQGGMYVLQLMDWYSASFSVLIIAVVECVVINWIYGNEVFSANVKEMLGHYPGKWWRFSWKYVSPIVIVAILVFSFVKYQPAKYGDYVYPVWADALGWMLVFAAAGPIFIVAIYKLLTAPGNTIKEKWREAIKPQINLPHVHCSIEEDPAKKYPMETKLNGLDDSLEMEDPLIVKANGGSHEVTAGGDTEKTHV